MREHIFDGAIIAKTSVCLEVDASMEKLFPLHSSVSPYFWFPLFLFTFVFTEIIFIGLTNAHVFMTFSGPTIIFFQENAGSIFFIVLGY